MRGAPRNRGKEGGEERREGSHRDRTRHIHGDIVEAGKGRERREDGFFRERMYGPVVI
jgi:hypothetical protein